MPFCPSCTTEYQEGTRACAECGATLVATLKDGTLPGDTADVYVCWDEQQLERVTELLDGEGIDWLVRDHGSSAFPLTVGDSAKRVVAVPATELTQAQQIIATAIADGVLPKND